MANFNVEEVERLNKLAGQKNAERQQLIGKRDAAQQAFNQAVAVYAQKYGVTLTAETLQSEYDKVCKETEANYNALSQMIKDIEEGKYKQKVQESAQTVASTEEQKVETVQTPEPVQTAQPIQTVQNTQPVQNAQSVPTQPQVNTPQQSFTQPQQSFTAPVNNQPTFGGFGMPTASNNADEDISERPVAPGTWGAQNVNKTFEDILGSDGEAVKFQI